MMYPLRRLCAFLLVPLALLGTFGCGAGGSGGSLTSTTTGKSAALDVYVTDGFTDAYKQVLATLYKIELSTDGTTYTSVYTSTTGQTIDLASLSSTAMLLASVTVPTGTYTSARITFGDHITLVSNSGTSTSVAVNPKAGTDTNGQIAVVVSTPTVVQANQNNAVYVDFKLAEFQLIGGVLQPTISCGGNSGSMQSKTFTAYVAGTVANLTSTGFTLQGPHGRTVTVTLSSSTTLTDGLTGKTITLANGDNVVVQGAYDPTNTTITATAVVLNDNVPTVNPRVAGTVASVNTTAGSFVLTVQHADGIQPTGGTITVQTNSSTLFLVGRGQTGSISNVTANTNVLVEGAFDATTQTLTATAVCLPPSAAGSSGGSGSGGSGLGGGGFGGGSGGFPGGGFGFGGHGF